MEIFEKVTNILSELSGTESICLDQELEKDLGLDSLQMVTLLIMIEETFDLLLDETDMNPFDLVTVSQVVSLVEKYVDGESHEETEKEN